ncbi:MAG: ATP-binding protein [Acidobacteriota bacterium]
MNPGAQLRRWFQNRSLQAKLTLLILMATSMTVALAGVAFLAYESSRLRKALGAELGAAAEVVASSSTAALEFHDERAAEENLHALEGDSRILEAALTGPQGEIVAAYRFQGKTIAVRRAGEYFEGDSVVLYRRIALEGKLLGMVYLRGDTRRSSEALWQAVAFAAIGFIVATGASFGVAFRLQKSITAPLFHLESTARAISEKGDYSVRAQKMAEDEVGRLTECFNTMLDQIRARDEALGRHRENLEAEVVARTAEWRLAKEKAEESTRVKSQFLANMSHEIRTPMNAIVGIADLLTLMDMDEDQQELVETVKLSGAGLLGLIDDILDLSKIEAGRMELESVAFQPRHLAEDAMRLIQPRADAKGLCLKLETAPGVPPVLLGDPARLRQILINFLGNAVKFTQTGEVILRVGLHGTAGDVYQIHFEVSDTGPGIDEHTIPELFEKFRQADSTTTRKYGGTGLGLAISKQLSELMGGSVGARNREGGGSVFWCDVPLRAGSLLDQSTGPGAGAGDLNTAALQGARVLLVEDNPVNQMVAQRMLLRLGCAVDLASSGEEAIEKWRQGNYAVVLMDCQMPEMDGYEAARRIRSQKTERARVPIVALTANAMDGDKQKCLDAGMDDYISKPVRFDVLKRHLVENLTPSATITAAAPPDAP